MTPKFRDTVERFDELSLSPTIDAELKDLFRQLSEWPHSPTTPSRLIEKLGIYNVYEQRDAAEYLEQILRLTSPEASQVFHGELTHHRECSRCKDGPDDHGSFWTLNLDINSVPTKVYDVQDAMEAFFRTSEFTGDNQMYCDTCQVKEDSIIECIFKNPPEVLVVLLKRFEFSYDIMGYAKNNSPVKVLLNIEMPKGRRYELYATVDHYGDLSWGHYTATIKPPDDADSWYNFNDSNVTRKDRFNPDGSCSAYLLFYRHRVCDVSPMTQPSKQMNDSHQGVQVGSSEDMQSGSSEDMQSGSSVDLQSGSSVDLQSGSSVDIHSELSVDPQSGSPVDPQSGSPVDPQSGSSVDPQSGSPVDVHSELSVDMQSRSSVDPQSGSPVDPQSGSPVDPQSGSPVEVIDSIQCLHIYIEEVESQDNVVTVRTRTKVGEIIPEQPMELKRKKEMTNEHYEPKKSMQTPDS